MGDKLLYPGNLTSGGLSQVATTGAAGFVLQNATPNILSWIAPNDGNLHNVEITGCLVTSVLNAGGGIKVTFTIGGSVKTLNMISQNATAGVAENMVFSVPIDPGTTITVAQTTALTAGASNYYGALFAN